MTTTDKDKKDASLKSKKSFLQKKFQDNRAGKSPEEEFGSSHRWKKTVKLK